MFLATLLAFLVILGLLVFFHELGHFLVAKLSGIKVEEFAFGFPPKLVCRRRGETKYCINLIPFGGYVKMLGEDRDHDSPRSFSRKKARFRFSVVVAGVAMNFILAGILLSIGFMIGMSPIRLNEDAFSGQKSFQIIVAEVRTDSPAEKAEIKQGDMILGFKNAEEFSRFTREKKGQEVEFAVRRDGTVANKKVNLSKSEEAPFGVGIADVPLLKLSFFKAIAAGFEEMALTTYYILGLFKTLIVQVFTGGSISESVAGPVKIFSVTGEAVKMGLSYLIQFAALLSINVGLINILPLPALDGGRALIIGAEGIFRRKVMRVEIENVLHTVGFVVIMVFVVAITFREVFALF